MAAFAKKTKPATDAKNASAEGCPTYEKTAMGELPPLEIAKITPCSTPLGGLPSPETPYLPHSVVNAGLSDSAMSYGSNPPKGAEQGPSQTNLNQILGPKVVSTTLPTWSTKPADPLVSALIRLVDRHVRALDPSVESLEGQFRTFYNDAMHLVGDEAGTTDADGKPDAIAWRRRAFEAHLAVIDYCDAAARRAPGHLLFLQDKMRAWHGLLDSTFLGLADELQRLGAKQVQADAAMRAGRWDDRKAAAYQLLCDRIDELAAALGRYRPDLMADLGGADGEPLPNYDGAKGPEAHLIAAGGLLAVTARFGQETAGDLWIALNAWREATPEARGQHADQYKATWARARAAETASQTNLQAIQAGKDAA